MQKTAALLFLILVLGIGIFFWVSRVPQVPVVENEVHILAGTTTTQGTYLYQEEKAYYIISAEYPANTGLVGTADAKARLVIEQALADRISEFKTNGNFDTLTAEDVAIQGLGEDRKYALDLEYTTYISSQYVSYAYSVYEDTLGAHPNVYYMTFVFDKEGNKLNISEVVGEAPETLPSIAAQSKSAILAELHKRMGIDAVDTLFEEGVAPKVENFSSFVVDGADLVVLFPPYQVAAYAAGTFEVRIPLQALRP